MVLVAAIQEYVSRMLADVKGMKALLLDQQTLGIVSLALSQSNILHKEVVLVKILDGSPGQSGLKHLKAVCFLRPTGSNINLLKKHLEDPRFAEYHLYFSNVLSNAYMHMLADADEKEVVQQVQEFFGDYFALDMFHFSLHVPDHHLSMWSAAMDARSQEGCQKIFERSVDALLAVFLSLRRRPLIRYQKNSEMARRVALETGRVMYEQERPLFDFRRMEVAPLLLVLDRREDPVTPLLNQWTYQAMVHELIGIVENRVDLKHVAGVADEQKEVVLSAEQDEFFRVHMYDNFGDIGAAVAQKVQELRRRDHRKQSMESLEDMAALLEAFPEYRQESALVAKHVTIMSELKRVVEQRLLFSVTQTEQDLACNSGQAAAFEAVMGHLDDPKVKDIDRLRLVMLYALRYEKENPRQLDLLMRKLSAKPSSKFRPSVVYTLLRLCGVDKRLTDLFGDRDIFNVVARNVKRNFTGIENVYTQHQPLLAQTVENAVKGRLRDVDFPFVGNHFQQARPQEVVVFMVGGTTYAEARVVAQMNALSPSVRVLLGGTGLLNSSRFISDLMELQSLEEASNLDGLPQSKRAEHV